MQILVLVLLILYIRQITHIKTTSASSRLNKNGICASLFIEKGFSISEIEKELRELNSNKATVFGNVPTKTLKQSNKNCSDILQKLFNDALRNGYFPD